jgi:endonuclease/exonuclease/phosphatase family metal-dependent hydrolase
LAGGSLHRLSVQVGLLAMLIALCGCLSGGTGKWPLEAERGGMKARFGAPSRELRVATYNISQQVYPQLLRNDIAAADVDVWMFQEVLVGRDSPIETVRGLLPDGEWDIAVMRVNPAADPKQVECQAIASRFPIRRTAIWPLDVQTERRRCALVAWIDLGNAELMMVNTDHEPGYFAWNVTQDRLLEALVGQLRQHPAGPMVVGGDFNSCGNFWRFRSSAIDAAHVMAMMKGEGFSSAVPPGTISYNRAGLSLDHLFFRGVDCRQAEVIASARGSNHFPLRARIAVSSP